MRLCWLCCVLCCGLTAMALEIAPFPPDALVFGATAMVPLRPLAELCGATLAFHPRQKAVTIRRGDITLTYHLRTGAMTRDGQVCPQPLPPLLQQGGVLYIPVRPFVQALGGTVSMAAGGLQVRFADPATTITMPLNPQSDPLACNIDPVPELCIVNLDGTGRRRLTYREGSIYEEELPVFSPDGTLLALGGWHGLMVRSLASPEMMWHYPADESASPFHAYNIAFTPEGTAIYCVTSAYGGITSLMMSVDDGKVINQADGQVFTPMADGYLLVATQLGRLSLHSRDGKIAVKIGDGFNPFSSPDGRTLYFHRFYTLHPDGWSTRLWQVAVSADGTVGQPAPVPLPDGTAEHVLISPTGAELFADGDDHCPGLYRLGAGGAGLTQLTREPDELLCISPDGQQLAFRRHDGLFLIDRAGANLRRIADLKVNGDEWCAATFTPDGRQIIFLDVPGRAGIRDSRQISEQ